MCRLPSQCKFSDHGCTIELMKTNLESHEKDCLYRMVRCADLACHEKIPFVGLLDHIKNDHEREDFVNAEGSNYKSHFIVNEDDFTRGKYPTLTKNYLKLKLFKFLPAFRCTVARWL